jgi:hypothetical protein
VGATLEGVTQCWWVGALVAGGGSIVGWVGGLDWGGEMPKYMANRGVSKIIPPLLAKTHSFGYAKTVHFIFHFFLILRGPN